MKGLGTFDDEVNPFGGDINPTDPVHDLVGLDNDDCATERRRLSDRRCLFRIWTGIEIALFVRFVGHQANDVGPQLGKIA